MELGEVNGVILLIVVPPVQQAAEVPLFQDIGGLLDTGKVLIGSFIRRVEFLYAGVPLFKEVPVHAVGIGRVVAYLAQPVYHPYLIAELEERYIAGRVLRRGEQGDQLLIPGLHLGEELGAVIGGGDWW